MSRPPWRFTLSVAVVGIAATIHGGLASARRGQPCSPGSIVVTTDNDADNGNMTSVASLLTDPGPDGVSLREAINATNNDPGCYTITFASSFTIQLVSMLPPLLGGNVTIQGPETIRGGPVAEPTPYASGFSLASSGNRLTAIAIEGFFLDGVHLSPSPGPLPIGVTFADNTIEALTIRGVRIGIDVGPFVDSECPSQGPCPTHNSYLNTTIVDNIIESTNFGIRLDLMHVVGDVLDGATIARNTIRLGTAAQPGRAAPIQIDVAGGSVSSRVANVTVADNTIESVQRGGDAAIFIGSGLQRAHGNVVEDIHVLRNRIHVERPNASVPCCHGIVVDAGNDYFTWTESGSPDDNMTRRVDVSDNEIVGALASGVRIQSGTDGGGSRNRVESVKVLRNVISSSILGRGVYLWAGQIGEGMTVTGNIIADVEIDSNTVTTASGAATADVVVETDGGVVLIGGADGGRNGSISNVRIARNTITSPNAGIRLLGGWAFAPDVESDAAKGNSISCVRIAGNRVLGGAVSLFAKANGNWASGNSLTFFMPDMGNVVLPDIANTSLALQDPLPTGC